MSSATIANHSHPTALISYSHDSPEHEQRVLALCNRLRSAGIDAFLDQFLAGAPPEGWPLWMERQIESSDYTLLVCTESYRRRFMDAEPAGIGRGVVWEARILRNLLYEDSQRNSKIIPLYFGAAGRRFVPTVLAGNAFDAQDEPGFEALIRHLRGEATAAPEEIGSLATEHGRWSAFEQPWLVPGGMRTRYFAGRKNLLDSLERRLNDSGRAVLSGLGGTGKTQTALAYAVRHRKLYPSGVFWVNAESPSSVIGGFIEIAKALRLEATSSSDQEHIVHATRAWFNGNDRWLLVFDNADDRGVIRGFIPETGDGHVLITSRESVFQEFGIARAIEVGDFEPSEAVEFLLDRTGRDGGDTGERSAAADLARELGNLPLALEQAAAYVAETNASYADYLASFRKRRVGLLERSHALVKHEPVARTWSANFDAVLAVSPAAADALRLTAFLAPDGVPFELFSEGAAAMGGPMADAMKGHEDTLSVSELLRPLTRYSLLRTDPRSRTFGVHRLVQEIVREQLTEEETRSLVMRAALGLNAIFPMADYASWTRCDRLIPHVLAVSRWITKVGHESAAAGNLLSFAGYYLVERGRYDEGQVLSEQALTLREHVLGPAHPDVAASLNNLALLHWNRGRYSQALPLVERALGIRELSFGPDDPRVAQSLDNLAGLFWAQGSYAVALDHCTRALRIRERALGSDHRDVAWSINNLASLYHRVGRDAEALAAAERALSIQQRCLGEDHPEVAWSLGNTIAELYREEGRAFEAEAAASRALEIQERTLGSDHPHVAYTLTNLAELRASENRFDEAAALHERALVIREHSLGNSHPEVADTLVNMARLHGRRRRHDEALPLLQRALAIRERSLGHDHPDTISVRRELESSPPSTTA